MLKRTPMRVHLKKVIDVLREGKKTWSELKKLGIPEKSLERALKENLEYWGLVEKKENYWIWYDKLRVFNSNQEYKVAIEHSQKLFPAFDEIRNFIFRLQDFLYIATREHLRSYPEIYQKLEKLEEVANQETEELIQRILQSINDPHKRFDRFKYHPLQLIPFFLTWSPENPIDIETRENLASELKPILEPYFDVFRSLSGDLSFLEFQVKMGQPLEGRCSLCPKIAIRTKGD
jgi:hypothetical protein